MRGWSWLQCNGAHLARQVRCSSVTAPTSAVASGADRLGRARQRGPGQARQGSSERLGTGRRGKGRQVGGGGCGRACQRGAAGTVREGRGGWGRHGQSERDCQMGPGGLESESLLGRAGPVRVDWGGVERARHVGEPWAGVDRQVRPGGSRAGYVSGGWAGAVGAAPDSQWGRQWGVGSGRGSQYGQVRRGQSVWTG